MRPNTPIQRPLPRVVGARRLLASGQLGAQLVHIAQTAADMDLAEADRRLAAANPPSARAPRTVPAEGACA